MIVIKITLVAQNAKYTHTNLAVRSLKGYCEKYAGNETDIDIEILELTINNDIRYVLRRIYETKPDAVGFSCYIWNVNRMRALAVDLRKLLPRAVLIAGGPEVSFEPKKNPDIAAFDIIVMGEGEEAFSRIISLLKDRVYGWELETEFYDGLDRIPGVAYWKDGDLAVSSGEVSSMHLERIPFAYINEAESLRQRTIYYETSRGCPFGCAYCLSGSAEGVRFLPLVRIVSDLEVFLRSNIRQVKFVDRTFNSNRSLAKSIWRYLIENDNGVTNFHFEIAADLLDEEMIRILTNARKGYFQFEIGVQTINKEVLKLINRKNNTDLIARNVSLIKSLNNIHIHLDLIAGLPGESLDSFMKSFNFVYALRPEHLQLGFLKLLKGSALRHDAGKLGIVFCDEAPYEVLYTKELCYEDISALHLLSEMAERYYNSGLFNHTLRYATGIFGDAAKFFLELGSFYEGSGSERQAYSKFKLYEILLEFCLTYNNGGIDGLLHDLLKLDMLLNENVGNAPKWFRSDLNRNEKSLAAHFYKNPENMRRYYPALSGHEARQISRMCRIEKFMYDIPSFIKSGYNDLQLRDTYVLFNYYSDSVNFRGVNCEYISIEL